MAGLADRLAGRVAVVHAENSTALKPLVLRGLRAGDAVLVKGSLGSRMGPLVAAIREAGAAGAAQIACG